MFLSRIWIIVAFKSLNILSCSACSYWTWHDIRSNNDVRLGWYQLFWNSQFNPKISVSWKGFFLSLVHPETHCSSCTKKKNLVTVCKTRHLSLLLFVHIVRKRVALSLQTWKMIRFLTAAGKRLLALVAVSSAHEIFAKSQLKAVLEHLHSKFIRILPIYFPLWFVLWALSKVWSKIYRDVEQKVFW